MQTLTSEGAGYRTRLMRNQEHAEQFASYLRANAQFTNVEVHEEPRAKMEMRYFVTYQPAGEQQRQALLQGRADERRARAEAEGEQYLIVPDPDGGRFFWVASTSGQVYEVTSHSCRCGDYVIRIGSLVEAHGDSIVGNQTPSSHRALRGLAASTVLASATPLQSTVARMFRHTPRSKQST